MILILRAPQWKVFRCDQRFRVLVVGRRFGKTQLALVELCQAAAPSHSSGRTITMGSAATASISWSWMNAPPWLRKP